MREAHWKLSLELQVLGCNRFLTSKIKCPLSNADEGMRFKHHKSHLNVVSSSSDTKSVSIGYELVVFQQLTPLQVHLTFHLCRRYWWKVVDSAVGSTENSAVQPSSAQTLSKLLCWHTTPSCCAAASPYRDKVKCRCSFQQVWADVVHPVYLELWISHW